MKNEIILFRKSIFGLMLLLGALMGMYAQDANDYKYDYSGVMEENPEAEIAVHYINLPSLSANRSKKVKEEEGKANAWVLGRIIAVHDDIAVPFKSNRENFSTTRASNLQTQFLYGFMAFELDQLEASAMQVKDPSGPRSYNFGSRLYPKVTTMATVARSIMKTYKVTSEASQNDDIQDKKQYSNSEDQLASKALKQSKNPF